MLMKRFLCIIFIICFCFELHAARLQVKNGLNQSTTIDLLLTDNKKETVKLQPGAVYDTNAWLAGFKGIRYTDDANNTRGSELSIPGLSAGITTLLIAPNGWLEIKGGTLVQWKRWHTPILSASSPISGTPMPPSANSGIGMAFNVGTIPISGF
jgi:hypothetical protein